MTGMREWGRGLKEVFLLLGVAAAVAVVTLLLAGADPLQALRFLLLGAFGSWSKVGQVLTAWIPLSLCACGLVVSFRIGLWNIGVEGQVVAGAIFATAVLRAASQESTSPAWVLSMAFAGAIAGGSVWAAISAFLKARAGVHEIFGGLGLNFVATAATLWLIFGPWKRPGVASMSGTEPFPVDLWLTVGPTLRVSSAGLGLALAVLLLTAGFLEQTRLGLAFKGIGRNPRAAPLHGLRTTRHYVYAMLLAGGCAGLAGAFQVAGVYHRLIPNISSTYGYLGLLVVMLANDRIRAVPAIALFFAALNVGSIQLPMMLKLDSSLSGIVQGSLVVAILVLRAWRQRRMTAA
jgi:general nucleoside transport system permease protein